MNFDLPLLIKNMNIDNFLVSDKILVNLNKTSHYFYQQT